MITYKEFLNLHPTKLKSQLPLDVSIGGQPLFTAVRPDFVVPTPTVDGYKVTPDQLLKLVLKARNQNSGDPVHVLSARKVIDKWGSSYGQSDGNYIATRDQLKNLVLKARNDSAQDPVHVNTAFSIVDAWLLQLNPEPTDPTPEPSTPVPPPPAPEPTLTAGISRPHWLGDWSGNVGEYVKGVVSANGPDVTTLLVMYNIPHRDNGNYSAGGLKTPEEYRNWTTQIADGIGANRAIVILEPDALGLAPGLATDVYRTERYEMLNDAVYILKQNPNTKVYMDLSMWLGVETATTMIDKIEGIDGFSCNVSGYVDMAQCLAFANAVSGRTGLRFVIDTSRNGQGEAHPGKWCNQTDTKIGLPNTLNPTLNCDYYLWIKVPGESDGLGINDDGSNPRSDVPSAGTLWPEFRDAIYSGDWAYFKHKYKV